jgi:hypothetical protein
MTYAAASTKDGSGRDVIRAGMGVHTSRTRVPPPAMRRAHVRTRTDGREALGDGADALVGGQDTLARRGDGILRERGAGGGDDVTPAVELSAPS